MHPIPFNMIILLLILQDASEIGTMVLIHIPNHTYILRMYFTQVCIRVTSAITKTTKYKFEWIKNDIHSLLFL